MKICGEPSWVFLSSKSGYYKNKIVEFCEFPIWLNTTNHYVNFEKNLCGKYLKTWNDNYILPLM